MNIRLYAALASIALATTACQVSKSRFIPSSWRTIESTTETVSDNTQGEEPDTQVLQDSNKILTLTDGAGNREYLLADSIQQQNGITTALIEFRYAKTQTLPANGMPYTHNHWLEQIDCQNKVRLLRSTTHYNNLGEIVDTNEYPLPKYKPAELAALAQPNDKVIQEVCQRIGAPVSTATTEDDTLPPPVVANASDVATASAPAETPKASEDATKKTKKKGKKDKEERVKVDTKIDFINKDKTETVAPATSASAPVAPEKDSKTTDVKATEKPITETKTSDDNGSTPLTPQQNDDLPPDFWEIGKPKD